MSTRDTSTDVACADALGPGAYRDQPAQRLWALERPASRSRDVYRFAAAVAVLDGTRVYVVVLKSAERERATEVALRQERLRMTFERAAARFDSLDGALEWAETIRSAWLARGWMDASTGEE